MSSPLKMASAAEYEVREACRLLRVRFPHVAKDLDSVEHMVKREIPLASRYYTNALKNVGDMSELDEDERQLVGRAANWLRGANYFAYVPLKEREEQPGTVSAVYIKRWCEERKISHARLAKLLNMPLKTVQNWVQGRNKAPAFLTLALERVDQILSLEAIDNQIAAE